MKFFKCFKTILLISCIMCNLFYSEPASSQAPKSSSKKKTLKIPKEVVEQEMPSYMYNLKQLIKKAEKNIKKIQKEESKTKK